MSTVQSYLFFNGRCEEAIEFYKGAIGAQVDRIMRNEDSPEPHPPGMLPPNSGKKVMHAAFRVGDTQILASDGHCDGRPKFEGFSLTITAPDVKEANRVFDALGKGGQVRMPLEKTFFSPAFGMLADKFGVGWMVLAEK